MTDEQQPGVTADSTSDAEPTSRTEQTSRASPDQEPAANQEPAASSGASGSGERWLLNRSRSDQIIAGVAGGLGAYFRIDPVIVRIAFIVLAFGGGAGIFLYLAGWLTLPRENARSVIAEALSGQTRHRFHSVLTVALIGLGTFVTAGLSTEIFDVSVKLWKGSAYLALILIAAGVALVLWPGPVRSRIRSSISAISAPRRRDAVTGARPPADPDQPAGVPPAAQRPDDRAAYTTPTSHRVQAHSAPPSGDEATAATPPHHESARSDPSRTGLLKRRSPRKQPPGQDPPTSKRLVGILTVASLIVCAGLSVVLHRLDVVDVDFGVLFAVALAITGTGLVVSAFTGRTRGLILLGAGLLMPLLLLAVVLIPRGGGIGEVDVIVIDAEDLRSEYNHGVGRLVLDLRELEPSGSVRSVRVSLGVGKAVVYLPVHLNTTADVHVGAGRISHYQAPSAGLSEGGSDSGHLGPWYVNDGSWDSYGMSRHAGVSGVDLDRRVVSPPRGDLTSELFIDINVGVGSVDVVAVPAAEHHSTQPRPA